MKLADLKPGVYLARYKPGKTGWEYVVYVDSLRKTTWHRNLYRVEEYGQDNPAVNTAPGWEYVNAIPMLLEAIKHE